MPAPMPNRQKAARNELRSLFAHPAGVRVIHYSSESFDNRENGKSPRVTSIAIRRLDNGQTDSFSIHAVAEERGVDLAAIANDYDSLEKEMLERFYVYIATDREAEYLHWNMRDANYGFSALAHRLRVLHGAPGDVPGHKRHDLARILQDLYGTEYIAHPRLEQLTKKNEITSTRFLTGKQEAEAFDRGDYVALHQSTLRKVDIIADIADRANGNTLLTNSNWWTMNGGSLRGALNWVATNAIVLLVISLASLAVGVLGTWIAVVGSAHAH